MDSKDKKYASGIERSLALFDSVEEWADYIAFLSKLLKALQQKHTTPHWIPHGLSISIVLSKCLSPNLPSGVHSKTLELYNFIFTELGIESLSSQVDLWVPGILPLMQFASISIKPMVIDLYKTRILTLPSDTLKTIVRPLLAYLIPSLDDERSEFFDASFALVASLKTELNDDALFWQSLFLIIITSEERRLGCLVWCNKKLPDLNLVVSEPTDDTEPTTEYYKSELRKQLTSEQQALITPELGLVIRAFIHALKSNNILIQRGFFDLLIKKLQLDSTVLQKLTPANDLRDLIMSALSAILKKDMSINRRVWTWLLGPETTSALHLEFFKTNGSMHLLDGLLKLLSGDLDQRPAFEQKIDALKISLALMDRWEISSDIIPRLLVPALRSVQNSVESKSYEYEDVLKSGAALFDAVETLTIYSALHSELIKESADIEFVLFVLQNFNVQEEEMIVHQLPLLLLTLLSRKSDSPVWFKIVNVIMDLIPQRAYLPIEHASESATELTTDDITERIQDYYTGTDVLKLPFQSADLSLVTLQLVTDIVVSNIDAPAALKFISVLNNTIDTIPELKYSNDKLVEILQTHDFQGSVIINVSKLFSKIHFSTPFLRIEVLKKIVFQLCELLRTSGNRYQVEAVKTLHTLTFTVSPSYVEAAITSYLLSLNSFSDRLHVFNYIWSHASDTSILDYPLHAILDDLDEANGSVYTVLQNWIINVVNTGHANRLFHLITAKFADCIDDNAVFDYHVSVLYKVLVIDLKKILPLFKEELTVINSIEYKDENVSTYKDFTLFQLERFVKARAFDAKTFGAVLKLYELLLDGSESWFEDHVTLIFMLAKELVLESNHDDENGIMFVVLFNHLTQLTKLLISTHNKVTDVLVKEDSTGKPFLVDFLLLSFVKFNNPDLLSTWIELLSASLKFQDEYIFKFVEPIALTIIKKVDELYGSDPEFKDDISISLLLTILEEVLSLFRTYVISIEINNTKNTQHDPGFFSTVAGVFNGDNNRRTSEEGVADENRRMLTTCLRGAIKTCFNIWKNSDQLLRTTSDSENASIKYQSLKLKHKSKHLMESLYELEPIEVLKTVICYVDKDDDAIVFKLLQVLDGTRPQLTIPFIFKLLNQTVRDPKLMRPTMFETSEFLVKYTSSLQDDLMEDIFNDTMIFLKSLSDDLNSYKPVLLNIDRFIAVFSTKLSHSKFGSQKKIKKDVGDLFLKIYPTSLNFKNAEISSALSSSINDYETLPQETNPEESTIGSTSEIIIGQEDIVKTMKFVGPRIKDIIPEADKQFTVVSTILVTLLTPSFKSKQFPKNIMSYQLDLLNTLVSHFPSSKSIKFLISEVFNDSQFFSVKIWDVSTWNSIVSKWMGNDASDRITEYIVKSTQSNTNIFNWNDDEQLLKRLTLRRISYLLLISEKDQHIVLLKDLFGKLDVLLGQSKGSSTVMAEIFILLRVIVLKFSEIHLNDYWTLIYTTLQHFFLNLLHAERGGAGAEIGTVFQASKLLDLLLVLKFEDFQEWIFIIDTINAIYKNAGIISLIDRISLKDELFEGDTQDISEKKLLLAKISESKGLRKPALIGVKSISSMSALKPFFDGLSYFNFENVYNGAAVDYESCQQDIFADIFDDDADA